MFLQTDTPERLYYDTQGARLLHSVKHEPSANDQATIISNVESFPRREALAPSGFVTRVDLDAFDYRDWPDLHFSLCSSSHVPGDSSQRLFYSKPHDISCVMPLHHHQANGAVSITVDVGFSHAALDKFFKLAFAGFRSPYGDDTAEISLKDFLETLFKAVRPPALPCRHPPLIPIHRIEWLHCLMKRAAASAAWLVVSVPLSM